MRLSGLGDDNHVQLSLRVRDRNGVLVREFPFNLKVESACPKGDNCTFIDMNRDTDEQGVVRFPIWSMTLKPETRVVTLTPRDSTKDVVKSVPIIVQKPFQFFHEKEEKIFDVLLAPGGGIEEAMPPLHDPRPAVELPKPEPSLPEPKTFPWGVVIFGAAVLVAGVLVVPRLLPDGRNG